ncbi:hypothetical protein ABL840_08980 [Variovorax sp. NFACC27]|uniref:hypothetical protein n=1 Tax=unclassified Variovorax TaxID=663243 RepID=UPI000B00B32F
MSTAVYKCVNCGEPFTARTADRKRGWARFCSKSCKAVKQEQRTGQHRAYQERRAGGESSFSNAHQFDNTEL